MRMMSTLRLSVAIVSLLAGCRAGSTQSSSTSSTTTSSRSRTHSAVRSGSARRGRARMSPAVARQTLVRFFTRIQSGDYVQVCAMFTSAVRTRLDRDFGGCVRNLAGLHALAQNQRARGLQEVLQSTVNRVKAARFSISGDTARTTAVGRPGTVTTLIFAHGHWEISRPAT